MSQELIEKLQNQMERLKGLKILLEQFKARREEPTESPLPCTAIIVEPRKHRALSFVLKNILENLDSNWKVKIYHGTKNKEFVEDLLETDLKQFRERISLENLGVDNLPTARAYSDILTSLKFTEEIPTETFLVFQTDSMINPRNKDLLKKFLKYDYVGAPWKNGQVGNGGFSLRKKSKMLEILRALPTNPQIDHEDMLFSFGAKGIHPLKPPFQEAKEFSMETVYTPISFGIHRAWVYHPEKIEEMCSNCPGLKTLIELQEEPKELLPSTAIIVEPRKHRALSFVLRNVLENLDSNWNVKIYHGTLNKEFVEDLLETDLKQFRERISLENLGVDNLPTSRIYSDILTSLKFMEGIPTETFLVFQTDSMINPRNKDLLKKFLNYDYVGAPWPWQQVGNGGFSLRKKSKMLEILNSAPPPNEYEDHIFSYGTKGVVPLKPSPKEAEEFSVETIYSPRSFGIHKVWFHLPKYIEQLKLDCPGLQTLIELQGVFD